MTPIAITIELADGSLVDTPIGELPGGGYVARFADSTVYLDVARSGRRAVTPAKAVFSQR